MKRIYSAPETTEQLIETCHMICVSGLLDANKTITDPKVVGARRHGAWDDEDGED